ncbi:ATP-dependent DNA helicase [Microbulbifer sp. JTAC008]|uniref:ATP-dependent DNA helicase n=1 Tax=unclassified Microbulbifer TaxID=2619833 RepID=UPI00403917E6
MASHLTLRLAWHNDGWNGRICEKPEQNTYCVGCASYPGDQIREQRDLEWEKVNAGRPIAELDKAPACMYSASAFSIRPNMVASEPPAFFNDDTKIRHWELPAATACTWPYEAMYNKPDLKVGNRYDYDKRLKYAEEHFEPVEADKSLVFYYANYSNPKSTDETPAYLLIGVARIKSVAPVMYYENCSERTLERYKGFIWQRGVTSHYPEQGIRLPYHRYLNDPDTLNKFVVVPENSGLCKYATKHVSDDEALGLLEQLLEAARIVREDLQDESENWGQRIAWLESLIGELWQSRGAYPGMPSVLQYLGLNEGVSGFRQAVNDGKEQEAVGEIKAFIAGARDDVVGYYPLDEELPSLRRSIALKIESEALLVDVLARCSLSLDQLNAILAEDRAKVGVSASLAEVEANPYLLSEQYVGMDVTDQIRWSIIDRGMLPSPELPAPVRFSKDAPERLRALLLETIRGNSQQTFVAAEALLQQVNARFAAQPEWKQNLLTEKYLKVDSDFYAGAIYQREEGGQRYLYDLQVWQDERLVEEQLNGLLMAPDIALPRPVSPGFWQKALFSEESVLAEKCRSEYQGAVEIQQSACAQIFNKHLGAITGGAGTGKTTILSAVIKAIRFVHGEGASVSIIAPTGKATDRLRESFASAEVNDVKIATIHSLLAKYGWLNPNMTLKRSGGKRINDIANIVIDESSMIDLSLMAALFRAIDWNAVSRLYLVGDAAQLPPIGVGKCYADIVTYLRDEYPDKLVDLKINLRQLENRVSGKGDALLRLARTFINDAVRGAEGESPEEGAERERLIQDLHLAGDISEDLSIAYWEDPEKLPDLVIETISKDLRDETNRDLSAAELWGRTLKNNINAFQILSPVRGTNHGTEWLNLSIQEFKSAYWLKKGNVDGITMFDKVIQKVNRTASKPLHGYNFHSKEKERLEAFNGEIGTVVPTGSWKGIKSPGYRFSQFSVKFKGKEHLSVNFGGRDRPEENLELAYAISVHKSQGSEFDHVYFVLPENSRGSQAKELIYTALTRAKVRCTVFVQGAVETLVNAMRPEHSALKTINSSMFSFNPVDPSIADKSSWYEAGKIHRALTGDMVRSKSEVIIANILHDRDISFWYEKPLRAPDGTMYLPDFTIMHRGEEYYWEHLGLMDLPEYQQAWSEKEAWYHKHFPGRLVTSQEGKELSAEALNVLSGLVSR